MRIIIILYGYIKCTEYIALEYDLWRLSRVFPL